MKDPQLPIDRRRTMKISGALALGAVSGLAGCFHEDPEDPGVPEDDDDDIDDDDIDDDDIDDDDVDDDDDPEATYTLTVTVVEALHEEDNEFDDDDEEFDDDNDVGDDDNDLDDDMDEEAGPPIEGATVTVEDETGILGGIFPDEADEGETDADGMVDVTLEDGEYTVIADHDDYEQGEEEVQIEGMDEELTIELEHAEDVDDDVGDEEADDDVGDDDNDL